jgi:threonine dehydrogenase-like Zn-dependent dehydrogenase
MPMMKAALYDGKGTMRIEELPQPEVERDTVIVRVRRSGICGSDLNIYRGMKEPEKLPAGHEPAGEIVEIGLGVEGWSIGDRVAVEAVAQGRACGRCRFCLAGQYRRCLNLVEGWGGAFAQYIKRKALGCYRLPDRLSWEEGALVEPLAVSVHGVRRGKLRWNETVVVLGAGTIGLTSIAAARTMGAGKLFATARYKHQAAMALRLGADAVFSPEGGELEEAIAGATGGLGADLVIETVGGRSSATLRQAISIARGLGRIVVLGGFREPVEVDFLTPLLNEQAIVFAQCYSILEERHDFDIAIDILASGTLPLEDMVTHTFPLERVQEAFSTAYDKSTGSIKVQLVP